jgi:hypothetical protein
VGTPAWVSAVVALSSAVPFIAICSTRCSWCIVARLSHSVVAMEVPIAPIVIRTKFDRPAAAGMRDGGRPASVSVVSGMKKNAIAPPWISVGSRMVPKSVSDVNLERIHSTSANSTNAPVAIQRGSHLATLRPTMGVSTIAKMPTGASAMPAEVAV